MRAKKHSARDVLAETALPLLLCKMSLLLILWPHSLILSGSNGHSLSQLASSLRDDVRGGREASLLEPFMSLPPRTLPHGQLRLEPKEKKPRGNLAHTSRSDAFKGPNGTSGL
jgi:hypothetical protein